MAPADVWCMGVSPARVRCRFAVVENSDFPAGHPFTLWMDVLMPVDITGRSHLGFCWKTLQRPMLVRPAEPAVPL